MTTRLFRPGQVVPRSGIYLVTHDPAHAVAHEVTVIFGRRFPPCRGCANPRFKLVRGAVHIASNRHFKRQ